MDPNLTLNDGIDANLRKWEENVDVMRSCLRDPKYFNPSHDTYKDAQTRASSAANRIYELKNLASALRTDVEKYPPEADAAEPPDIQIPDRPAHGGYPESGLTLPMTGVPNTLAEVQRQHVAMLERDAIGSPYHVKMLERDASCKPERPTFKKGDQVIVISSASCLRFKVGIVQASRHPDYYDVKIEGELYGFHWNSIAPWPELDSPPAPDPRLKVLSDFARTAPGRLPQEVQDALVE